MAPYCAAYNCKNTIDKKSGLSSHRFPKDPELRRRWVIATKRKGFTPSETTVLCSAHFEGSAFEIGGLVKRLKKDAVPTLFDFPPHLKTSQPKKRRKHTNLKCTSRKALLDDKTDLSTTSQSQDLKPVVECAVEVGSELLPDSEPGSSSQVQPFTFVNVVSVNDEDCLKRCKYECPESNDEDSSNVHIKMELEEEYDLSNSLPNNLHISNVATISPAEFSTTNFRPTDNDDSCVFGERVAESLRALAHESSRQKLKAMINEAIEQVTLEDQLLS